MAYKTIIEINIESDEPIPNDMTFEEIIDACDTGKYIGTYTSVIRNQKFETLYEFLKNFMGFRKNKYKVI
jgi:hypothetical protein